MTLSRRQLLAGLPAMLAAPAGWSQAAFPSRSVTLVVPFAAGGGTDLVARIVARHMEGTLGQSVVVENKAGANGNIAGAFVAKAPADGHTVLYNTSSMVISPAVYRNTGFDALKDLAPVGLSANIATGMLVAPELPVRTLADLVAYGKANPGKLSYGSSGAGNINHMSALQFTQATGIEAVHVPYKGSAPATVDLSAGRIQFMIDTVPNVAGFIKEGKLRLLATSTVQRMAMFPAVPTFGESGVPGFESGAWNGVVVPARTPPAAIARLNAALLAALNAPEVRQKLEEQGTQVLGSSPQDYGRFLRTEAERWAAVARKARLEPP